MEMKVEMNHQIKNNFKENSKVDLAAGTNRDLFRYCRANNLPFSLKF